MSATNPKAVRRRRRTVTEKEGALTLSATAKSVLMALFITVAASLLLLFITTALLLQTNDPNRYHTAAGLAIAYVSALIGGFSATKLNRCRSPLLCGAAEGLLLLLVMTAVGLCMPIAWRHSRSAGMALLTHAMLLPASLLGALFASRKREKRHRRKHR